MQFLSTGEFKDRDDVSFIELLLLREKVRVMMNVCLYVTNGFKKKCILNVYVCLCIYLFIVH